MKAAKKPCSMGKVAAAMAVAQTSIPAVKKLRMAGHRLAQAATRTIFYQ
jgi:hypothetical protein